MKYFMESRSASWGGQFKNAIMLGPSIGEDNTIDDVTAGEAIMHVLTMPWKVFFALVPPRHYWGGWLAFIVALALIGGIVVVVGEFAELLGCVANIKTSVSAITLVALGTSLPDTFASKTAAQTSEYADSAVGNVTGSNSVNVFLGMGLPWLIATIYHKTKFDSDYAVPPGSLTFSVSVFLACSLVCFFILGLRRCIIGGELGGPKASRNLSGFILIGLWVTYVTVLSLKAYEVI